MIHCAHWEPNHQLGYPGSFPYKPDQLTTESLERCLRESDSITDANTHVKAITSKGFGDGAGFMGLMSRLTVEYEGPQAESLPTRIVAKFGAADLEARILARFTMSGVTEAEIYSKSVAGGAGMPQPTCYYAKSDSITDHTLILMEDLAPLKVADSLIPMRQV